MNIIQALQVINKGQSIRNGTLARIDHFLTYRGVGVFHEYELISGKSLTSSKEYKGEIKNFSVAYILSNDWEIFDCSGLLES